MRRLGVYFLVWFVACPLIFAAWIAFRGTAQEREYARAQVLRIVEVLEAECPTGSSYCPRPRFGDITPTAMARAYETRRPDVVASVQLMAYAVASTMIWLTILSLWWREKSRAHRFHISGQQLATAAQIAKQTTKQ